MFNVVYLMYNIERNLDPRQITNIARAKGSYKNAA